MKLLIMLATSLVISNIASSEEVENISMFPPNTFEKFQGKLYSYALEGMSEAPIYSQKDKNPVLYRLTYVRAHTYPFCITVKMQGKGQYTYTIKHFFKKGHTVPDKAYEKTGGVKPSSVKEFSKLLIKHKFREMESSVDSLILDGYDIVLEVFENHKYKVVGRKCPDNKSEIHQLGKWFIELSDWKPIFPYSRENRVGGGF